MNNEEEREKMFGHLRERHVFTHPTGSISPELARATIVGPAELCRMSVPFAETDVSHCFLMNRILSMELGRI